MSEYSSRPFKVIEDKKPEGWLSVFSSAVGKLSTLGRVQYRPIAWLVTCGVLLVVAIIVGAAILTFHFRDRALDNTKRELGNTALLLASELTRDFQAIELAMTSFIAQFNLEGVTSGKDFERMMATYNIHSKLKDRVVALPHVSALTLTNSDGDTINHSGEWPSQRISLADRNYFQKLKLDPQLKFHITEPVISRRTGTWTAVVARRISSSNGEFLGLLIGAVELEHFEKYFSKLLLGNESSISIFRDDGILLVRYPRIEGTIGRIFLGFKDALKNSDRGTVRLVGNMDSKDRLLAIHRLDQYPLVISVGVDVAAVLTDWKEQTGILITLVSFSVLVIGLVLFLIVRLLLREYKLSEQRLSDQKFHLDTALNNMSQGLLMFDSSKRIVFCNDRYIEMYGLSRQTVKPGCTFRELVRHRKETGSFFGDIDKKCADLDGALAEGKISSLVVETTNNRSIRIVNHPMANGGWVGTHEDITEQKRADERIAHLASYDALTGLPNRTLFHVQLGQAVKWVRRGEQLAVLYLDLDHFKSVNDTLGHPAGDELLKAVADRLRGCLRETDLIARLGGDEFAIVQTAVKLPTDTTVLAQRLHKVIRAPYDLEGHQVIADVSIGISIAPEDGTDPDQLLKNADLALYGAKADGRGTYRFFEPEMDARMKKRRALEVDLRMALAKDELELHYQPIVNLQHNKISGCEALLRWVHPERGMISPAEFISVAEETGLIVQFGEWVLRQACVTAATWPADIKVAVNISPVQFRDRSLLNVVTSALAASNLSPYRLELEITEISSFAEQ